MLVPRCPCSIQSDWLSISQTEEVQGQEGQRTLYIFLFIHSFIQWRGLRWDASLMETLGARSQGRPKWYPNFLMLLYTRYIRLDAMNGVIVINCRRTPSRKLEYKWLRPRNHYQKHYYSNRSTVLIVIRQLFAVVVARAEDLGLHFVCINMQHGTIMVFSG